MTLKLRSAYLKYQMSQVSINSDTFNFGTNLGLTSGKYLIKLFLTSKSRLGYSKYHICQISINSEPF